MTKTDTGVPRPCKPGKTGLYWTSCVSMAGQSTTIGEGGARGSLGVTCTFLVEALCFSSSPDPVGCPQLSSALRFSWFSSFLFPSRTQTTLETQAMVYYSDKRLLNPSYKTSACTWMITRITWLLSCPFSFSSSARRSPNLERLFSSSSHRAWESWAVWDSMPCFWT